MTVLNDKQLEMCATSKWDFSDLNALFINCTLKRSPERSHTQGLVDIAAGIMEKNGVATETIRAVGAEKLQPQFDAAYRTLQHLRHADSFCHLGCIKRTKNTALRYR